MDLHTFHHDVLETVRKCGDGRYPPRGWEHESYQQQFFKGYFDVARTSLTSGGPWNGGLWFGSLIADALDVQLANLASFAAAFALRYWAALFADFVERSVDM